jgi:dihydropteroate synthase
MFTLNCKGRLLVIDKPVVMGVINVTPDSFYSESRQQTVESALKKAEQMINEGATILDIGGQSTRPDSEKLTAEEELKRVIAPVEAIHKNFPETFISIDTFYSTVCKEAVTAGASIVNDISAGSIDKEMISTVATLNVPYVLMHMKGTPQTMQKEPVYENVTREVLDFFIQKTDQLKKDGIRDVIIDPGFGFGKTIGHNFELLSNLSVFKMLHCPLLLGVSRKSFIYKTIGITAKESLNGTTAVHTMGLMNGSSLLRVHDVKEAVETIKLFNAVRS